MKRRKSVPSFVPDGHIRWLVGRLHVSTPDNEIEADIRRRLAINPDITEKQIKVCVKYAIACHRENQNLYHMVVTGRIN